VPNLQSKRLPNGRIGLWGPLSTSWVRVSLDLSSVAEVESARPLEATRPEVDRQKCVCVATTTLVFVSRYNSLKSLRPLRLAGCSQVALPGPIPTWLPLGRGNGDHVRKYGRTHAGLRVGGQD
jgi:hypothetical protein